MIQGQEMLKGANAKAIHVQLNALMIHSADHVVITIFTQVVRRRVTTFYNQANITVGGDCGLAD